MDTIYTSLRYARERLTPVSESPATDAQVLLCDILNVDRAYLFTHPEHLLTEDQVATYGMFVERCAAGEPLPYVRGKQAWYDREFVISPAVLIPRPETELLLEQALTWSSAHSSGQAIDVGTGSGILAVTFAAHRPTWDVSALDASLAALAIAQQNAACHGVSERVAFYESDLLNSSRITQRSLLIMANLPYIPTLDLPGLRVSQHEPMLALDGGADGLALIRRLLVQVGEVWSKGDVERNEHDEARPYSTPRTPEHMLVLLEIEARQGVAVAALAAQQLPAASVDVLRDYAGHDRIVRIEISAR